VSDPSLPELAFADAIDLAELLRRGELHPRELIAASIARIERLNPALNAVVTPLFEQAHAAAARIERDARSARGSASKPARVSSSSSYPIVPLTGRSPTDAPLAGVPMLVKDLMAHCAGARHTNGTRLLARHVAPADSALVARLRRAGLVPVGLTNSSELGGAPITENALFGATRHPWNPGLSPAGSSGGSAVAVAAGIVPVAHGNDTGGSLRNPASCCGLFALKPSRGRMPLEPAHGPLLSRLLVEHVLTRSVRDSARVLDLTHGALPGEPHPAPAPAPVPGAFEAALRLPVRRLRIALSTRTLTGAKPHPDCAAAAEHAAKACAELGHEVVPEEPVFPDPAGLVEAWFGLWADVILTLVRQAQALAGRAPDAVPGDDQLEPRTRGWYEQGLRRTEADRLRSLHALDAGARGVAELLGRHDLWLTPTLALPAIPSGAFDAAPGAGMGESAASVPYMAFSPYTRIANMTGCPAMSVPLHTSAAGLPVGAHFLGRMWEEATLLGLAAQLERAAPWRGRRPPLRIGAESPSAGSPSVK
jgi:amidase